MIFTYDKESGAAYLQLIEVDDDSGAVSRTEPISDDINVDYDSSGRIFGIEFLNASNQLPESLLAEENIHYRKSA